jgi:hypothetical protein
VQAESRFCRFHHAISTCKDVLNLCAKYKVRPGHSSGPDEEDFEATQTQILSIKNEVNIMTQELLSLKEAMNHVDGLDTGKRNSFHCQMPSISFERNVKRKNVSGADHLNAAITEERIVQECRRNVHAGGMSHKMEWSLNVEHYDKLIAGKPVMERSLKNRVSMRHF